MSKYIAKVRKKVKETLQKQPKQSVAHGFDHSQRVEKRAIYLAKQIQKRKGKIKINMEVLQVAALIHDVDQPYDQKGSHVEKSIEKAKEILKAINYPYSKTEKVLKVISEHSSETVRTPSSIEAKILFDADKLDGFGTIGIARVFGYCGQRGLTPKEAVQWYKQKIKKAAPLMQTETGKEMVREKAKEVFSFLKRYEQEEAKLKKI